MKRCYSILACLLSFSLAFSQQMIVGKVVDTTGHPLRSISVYLNNTSMGTTTNEKGEFLLDHIPPAKYRLIVSGVAFKTVGKMIDTRVSIPYMTITLLTQVDVLKGAVVRADDPDGWAHWGKLFIDLFVGTSPAARDCHILNPELIRFRKRLLGLGEHNGHRPALRLHIRAGSVPWRSVNGWQSSCRETSGLPPRPQRSDTAAGPPFF